MSANNYDQNGRFVYLQYDFSSFSNMHRTDGIMSTQLQERETGNWIFYGDAKSLLHMSRVTGTFDCQVT